MKVNSKNMTLLGMRINFINDILAVFHRHDVCLDYQNSQWQVRPLDKEAVHRLLKDTILQEAFTD